MKILPYLLLNLVVVGGGIVIYDQIREDAPKAGFIDGSVDAVDEDRLVARVVERLGDNQPALATSGTDPRVLARLADLEKRLGSAPSTKPAPSTEAGAESDSPMASPEQPADGDEVVDEELAHFRRLMKRAEEARRQEREEQRINDMLERLEIKLTPPQKTKLMTSMRSFRTRMGETMRKAFQGGGGRDAAREAMDGLRQEFTVELQEYLSIGDVQKITDGAAGMLRGFGGGRRGPR